MTTIKVSSVILRKVRKQQQKEFFLPTDALLLAVSEPQRGYDGLRDISDEAPLAESPEARPRGL